VKSLTHPIFLAIFFTPKNHASNHTCCSTNVFDRTCTFKLTDELNYSICQAEMV
jgi:hypothetical protein